MRVLTIAGRCLLAVLGLCLLCIVLLAVFFNPNAYRSDLEAWLTQQTGRPFTLHGDLSWHVGTQLFLTLPAIRIGEAVEDADFASWQQAQVSVALWPLLRGRLALGEVRVEGLKLNLRRDAHGRSNWDDLLQRFTQDSGPSRLAFERVAALQLNDAQISFVDQLQQRDAALKLKHLTTTAVQIDEPFKLVIDAQLDSHAAAHSLQLPFEMQVQVHADPAAQQITLTQLQGSGQVTGHMTRKSVDITTQALPWTLHLHELDWHGTTQDFSTSLRATLGTAQVDASLVANGETRIDSKLQFSAPQLRAWLQSLGISATTKDASALQHLQLQVQLSGSMQRLMVKVPQLQLDQTSATAMATLDLANMHYDFNVNADRLNLDRYLPATKESGKAKPTPLPIAWLRQLPATGTLQIDHAHLQGIDAHHLTLALDGE